MSMREADVANLANGGLPRNTESSPILQMAALETAANSIMITDRRGTILWVNPAFTKLTGYTPDEVLGKNPRLLKSGHHDEGFYKEFWGTLLSGKTWHGEFTNRRKDGTLYHDEHTITPVRLKGEEITHFVAIMEDITARKWAEADVRRLTAELEAKVAERTAELQAANHEMEGFIYSASHDLNTPVRGIGALASILLEDFPNLDPAAKDHVERIRQNAKWIGQLLQGLVQLSRVAHTPMEAQRVDLSAMARLILRDCQNSQPDRRVEIVVAEGLSTYGDLALLRSMMQNLLSNAWKFTAKKERARVEFGSTAANEETAFFVRDDGAGFDMAYANKLFKPFQRLHSQEEFAGIGIGLASAQRIIHRHGGRIWVESKPNEGTTFCFTLLLME